MKYSNLTHKFATLLLLAGAVSACRDQVDFDAEHQKLIEFQYKENFTNRFGEGAENQNFNMAQQVTATVRVDEYEDIQGAVIKVFTELPGNANASLLAEYPLTGHTMSFTFDSPKGLNTVFVTKVRGNGYYATKVATIDGQSCDINFSDQNGTRAASTTRAAANIDDYYWPSELEKGDSQFPASYPTADVLDLTGSINRIYHEEGKAYYEKNGEKIQILQKNIYFHNATIGEINLQNGGLNYYFSGDVKVNNWQKEADGADYVNFFFLADSKVDINRSSFDNKKQTLTICEGSELTLTNCIHTQADIYNRGTINITSSTFMFGDDAFCQNEGTIIANDTCNLTKDRTIVLNKGTLTAGSMNLEGSSAFYNSGKAEIAGKTLVNSNHSVWLNKGYFHTQTMDIRSVSDRWINGCQLFVDGLLSINLGNNNYAVHIESYVECGSYEQNVTRLEMGNDSQINVLGTASFNYNCGNQWNNYSQGIYSIADEGYKAVFKAEKIVMSNPGTRPAMTYGGRLIVDCADHFAKEQDPWNLNYVVIDDLVEFAPGGNSYTIPSSDCTLEYEPEKPVPPTGTPYTWMVACEDLGASDDFDFNDVVFSVSHTAGKTELYVTPLAAGGVLGSIVMYDNQPIGEIHYLLNGSSPATKSGSYEMLNTTRGANEIKAVPVKVDNVPSDFTMTNSSFQIAVIPNGSSASENNASLLEKATIVKMPVKDPTSFGYTTPQMLILPDGWIWPAERHQIDEAYPDFATWVSDNLSDWTSNSVSEHLFKDYQASNDNNNGNAGSGSNSNTGNNTGSGNTDNGGNSSGSTPEEDAPSVPEGGEIVLFVGSINLNWYPGYSDLSSFSWNNITAGTVLHIESDNNQSSVNIKLGYIDNSGFLEMLGGYYTESSIDFTLTKEHIEAFSKGLNIRGEGTLTKLSLKK